ncbi:hypothetical protein LTR78_008415 [Recurvomyces mirabilis]|uniref:Uncharacterized protein n=1 Tax=Recurvomyces mirabilis TaxID=574656 RepID=A0AAE0TQZ2_9PEZI|nr:hypothetical protein LTR78_008415 [Recurvomyces mirabilis]KAK5155403.1 hypothetical protein LTS14_005664 [Recurvomyces mirabilis]
MRALPELEIHLIVTSGTIAEDVAHSGTLLENWPRACQVGHLTLFMYDNFFLKGKEEFDRMAALVRTWIHAVHCETCEVRSEWQYGGLIVGRWVREKDGTWAEADVAKSAWGGPGPPPSQERVMEVYDAVKRALPGPAGQSQ